MAPGAYSEDTLVQQTTADYLADTLGWVSVSAYNNEDFGPDSLLGRASDREVVLTRTLREKYALQRDGVQVTWRNEKGERVRDRLRILNFDDPAANDFLCVRELWVRSLSGHGARCDRLVDPGPRTNTSENQGGHRWPFCFYRTQRQQIKRKYSVNPFVA